MRYVVVNFHTYQEVRGFSDDVIGKIVARIAESPFKPVFVGDRRLQERISRVANGIDSINFAGQTDLEQLIDIMQGSSGFLGIDSGPMHLAFAFRKPVLALFKCVDPRNRAPVFYGNGDLFSSYTPCYGAKRFPCFDITGGFPKSCDCARREDERNILSRVAEFLDAIA